MIIKSFKVCGISNAMDSSKDYHFEYPQEICQKLIMIYLMILI